MREIDSIIKDIEEYLFVQLPLRKKNHNVYWDLVSMHRRGESFTPHQLQLLKEFHDLIKKAGCCSG